MTEGTTALNMRMLSEGTLSGVGVDCHVSAQRGPQAAPRQALKRVPKRFKDGGHDKLAHADQAKR